MRRRLCVLAGAVAMAAFLAGPASAYMVYVSNEKDNTITVVDSSTMQVVKTVNVGQRPRGITISHDGKHIYLCASDDDTIEVIDTATLEVVDTLPSGPDPELFVLSPDGKTLYVANEDDNLVTVIDIESKKVLAEIPVGVEPEGMGVSPDGKTMVNTSETTNMAHFIDTSTHEITDNVLVDSRPRFVEFTPDGSQAWVSAEIGGTVSVIDNASREVIHKITFEIAGLRSESIQPVGVRITADGKKAYVALGPANRVAVVNTETYAVEKYVLVGQRVWQLAFTPDQKTIISTNGVSNDITFIDVATDEPVQSVTVGALPWGVVVSPN
ncbi:PQQ-dependent catabolism-associated beta-propeller protein [Mesorhizobium albiziae]|uniref:PQQ-dependent catabolism-associated beta-propeller protein n=1 Tax=Neomesorhizobium albiziae TaxID=335020 RepID=A0A1I3VNI8_9HYPH|nr:YVTN family beta-propeller repeat protein [Mesorhizobium albiziae]GLS29000.1 membrane protein [Mesorhizobium albiziae]SFJ95807.1 PQQ-dependent catabolism-associated beta-propeller protein [Mesorhizobium albiziae]